MRTADLPILGRIVLQRLRTLLFQDGWRKACAFLLATICWFLIFRQVTPANRKWDTVADVPLDVRRSPDLYIPEQRIPKLQLRIAVNYSYTDRHFLPQDFLVQVNPGALAVAPADGTRPLARYKITLSDRHVLRKPEGVSILGFDPPEIYLALDRIVQVQKDLHVQVRGRLREGYGYSLHAVPSRVTLQGPASLVNQIAEVETRPLRLDPRHHRDFVSSVGIPSPDDRLLKVYPDKAEVQVTIESARALAVHRFGRLPLQILTASPMALVPADPLPRHVEAVLQGRRDLLKQLEGQPPQAYLDLTAFASPGRRNVKVQLTDLPAGVALKSISPATIAVDLKEPAPPPAPAE